MSNSLLRTALASAALCLCAAPAGAQLFGLPIPNIFKNNGGTDANRNAGTEQDQGAVRQEAEAFAAKHEPWAQPLMKALYLDGEWGAVLNFERLGLAAMENQKFELAKRAFDQAITRVEEIYAADANAQKARSVFNAEAVKDFKGEPYERAMLYYYRGVLYARDGDYQNARASFLAADRHITLSSAESTAFSSDFGMLKYLAGWASLCDNDDARGAQLLEEARKMDSKIAALPEKPARALLLAETGPAPEKWGDGQFKEVLKFRPGKGDDTAPQLRTGSGETVQDPPLAGDIVHQATTRGGREVDGILAGKAQFKGNANQVGDIALAVGTQAVMTGSMTGNNSMANAGLAGMFIGVVAKAAGAAANPAADVRAWETLPAHIYLVTRPAGAANAALLVDGQPRPMLLTASSGRCSLAWGRATVAGTPVPRDPTINVEANRGDRNKALRQMLAQDFASSN